MTQIAMPESVELTGRPLILSYSGGKDSGAAWLACRDAGYDPDYILTADTGWESLLWYDHIADFAHRMGRELTVVRAEVDVPVSAMPYVLEIEEMLGISPSPMVRSIIRKAMFPSRQRKFCSEDLKHNPCVAWVEDHDLEAGIHITGIRADESRTRALYRVDELHPKSGQWHWRPILLWTALDAVAIHKRHRMPLCSLYDLGVSRVGCWPCIPARNKSEVRVLDKQRVDTIRRLEDVVNLLSKDRRDAQGLGRTGMLHFEISDVPGIPDIDTAIAHAKTYRGGHRDQGQLFLPKALDTCQRWGICDAGTDNDFGC